MFIETCYSHTGAFHEKVYQIIVAAKPEIHLVGKALNPMLSCLYRGPMFQSHSTEPSRLISVRTDRDYDHPQYFDQTCASLEL